MRKKTGTLLSALAALLSGCGTAQPASQEAPKPAEQTTVQETKPALDTDDFNASLIRFIEANGYENRNYVISPTSFRAALALAAAGAESETKTELLSAMGFNDMEELNQWYSSVAASQENFNQWLKKAVEDFENNREEYSDTAEAPDGAFSLENSVWRNTSSAGELSDRYKEYVKEHYDAKAENVSEEEITGAVNDWINENTNGMIPRISDDLSASALVLANTLYLRTAWATEFDEYFTKEGDFTAYDGKTVKKEFMHLREEFAFYEDDETTLVCLPMQGGVKALFVLGNADNAMEKLRSASYETVDVTLPKFETETSLSQNELIDFCKERGVESAFSGKADFSGMSEEMSLYITDIIQKAKIKTDEDGIEASAATVIMLLETALPPQEEPEVKEFKADRPFKFILFTDNGTPELLFCGQIVE